MGLVVAIQKFLLLNYNKKNKNPIQFSNVKKRQLHRNTSNSFISSCPVHPSTKFGQSFQQFQSQCEGGGLLVADQKKNISLKNKHCHSVYTTTLSHQRKPSEMNTSSQCSSLMQKELNSSEHRLYCKNPSFIWSAAFSFT